MAQDLTARDLVYSAIPDLLLGPNFTTTRSTQNIEVKVKIVHWTSFEKGVRQGSNSVRWDHYPEVLAYRPSEEHARPNHTCSEQVYCGDEPSISARFGHNVGHVMTAVFRTLGIPARFGASKSCENTGLGELGPDLILRDDAGKLLVVGEVKTPWKHNLRNIMRSVQKVIRHCLGQISRYMNFAQVKYGFLTTYTETIFLKQDKHPGNPNEDTLWYSNVILSNTESSNANDNLKVSVRECFLFIGQNIQMGDHYYENKLPKRRLVGDRVGTYGDKDHISPDESPEKSSSSIEHDSSPRQPSPVLTSSLRVTRSQTRARRIQDQLSNSNKKQEFR